VQRRAIAIVLAGVAGMGFGGWTIHHLKASTKERVARPSPDERRHGPGIHRAGIAELAVHDRVALAESIKLQRPREAAKQSVPSSTWVSLGPTDSPQEFNFFTIASVDSGRPNTILVDPRDGNVVYNAVSGGGLWKTYDFSSPSGPHWAPTTDTQPNLAIGALAMDPDHPDTLFVGNGDFVDTAGNTILKSTDGGGTWSVPVVLDGMYPSGIAAKVRAIFDITVHGNTVLAATDAGLFSSTDGGATFALLDLPNVGGALSESVGSLVSIGGGGYVASGIAACGPGAPPPGALFGNNPSAGCLLGNNAAIWRTTDGTTWTAVSPLPLATTTGRTTLASGPTTDPAHTVVYAFVGAFDGSKTLGFWRSDDAGATWTDATGTLANPTLAVPLPATTDCADIDVGHGQSWYNQAIVVDPTDPAHVLVGGNLCGMRTLNGTSATPTWELVSHWLPGTSDFSSGETANGQLPYVHADWHAATSVVVNGQVVTFAGTDGGVFSSPDVFHPTTQAENVTWTHHNRGLATHLMYSVASGDPVTANPFVLFSGLQDNGTRFRADPSTPSAFNQPIGGDGIGTTVHAGAAGTTYWASVEFAWAFCFPAQTDCSVEQPEALTDAESHWHSPVTPVGLTASEEEIDERMATRAKISGEDQDPFFIHYANVEPDTGQSILTHSDEQVLVAVPLAGGFTLTPISQDLTTDPNGAGFSNIAASRVNPNVYGASGLVSLQPFYFTTTGNTKAVWTATKPVFPAGDTRRLTGASALDFPPGEPTGTLPGQVFIGAFTGTMNDAARTPPPDDKGHLYRTTDFGQTWQSIVGADPAHRIPNVPVYVVKYDPVTPTTIYAGTDLGVYFTIDDGANWDRMGDNFPMVPVRDMYVAKNQDFIRVATYGRGLWEIYPSDQAGHGAAGNGDYDRNLKIDWIDVAATSARLGETPATLEPPLYSWILDITGEGATPIQQIDDDDLVALLAKFGGHP
jgi:hypothetical protein